MFYWLIKGIAWPIRILYFRIEVEGVEHLPRRGGAIVISNHSSYLDAGILGSILPRKLHFIVLSSMYARWRLRWFYWGMDTIPVRRDRADPAAIRRALQVVKRGSVLGVFPEGGRSPDGRTTRAASSPATSRRRTPAPSAACGRGCRRRSGC